MADSKAEVSVYETQPHHDGEDLRLEKLDTLHGDEAVKVLAAYNGDETWTPQEEKKLRRKIDWKLLPVLCMTYGLLYYDKVMIGHAVRYFQNFVIQGVFLTMNEGSVWHQGRPGPGNRQSLLYGSFDLLPWLRARRLPSDRPRSKIPDRASCLRNHRGMGIGIDSNARLYQLPGPLRTEILLRLL
jgi:hypothetical protein